MIEKKITIKIGDELWAHKHRWYPHPIEIGRAGPTTFRQRVNVGRVESPAWYVDTKEGYLRSDLFLTERECTADCINCVMVEITRKIDLHSELIATLRDLDRVTLCKKQDREI